jgi:hypothetical protein
MKSLKEVTGQIVSVFWLWDKTSGRLSTYNVCNLVYSTVRKIIHSICCKMYTTCTNFILQKSETFLCQSPKNFPPTFLICKQKFWFQKRKPLPIVIKMQPCTWTMKSLKVTVQIVSGIFHGSEIYSFNLLQNVHVRISFYRNRKTFCVNP